MVGDPAQMVVIVEKVGTVAQKSSKRSIYTL